MNSFDIPPREENKNHIERIIRHKQLVLFAGVIGGLFLGILGSNFFLSPNHQEQPIHHVSGAGIDESLLATLTRGASPEMNWTRRSENRLAQMTERLKELENENQQIRTDLQTLRQETKDGLSVIDEPFPLEEEGYFYPESEPFDPGEEFIDYVGSPQEFEDPFGPVNLSPLAETRFDQPELSSSLEAVPVPEPSFLVTFDLEEKGDLLAKPVETYLPAGSYAPAKVIAGADASVGLQNQADPRPVLLRITGPARTASIDGVVQEIDLNGCTVIAEARGDLSSEKVYVRPQTLTCARTPGEVIETAIYGYVAGSGKAGIRGQVISREGDLIDKALLAGLVQGVGQGASRVFRPQDLALAGGQVVGQTSLGDRIQDVGLSSLGTGLGSAANTVSQYLIDRAEQYQPVITLQSNTPVEIVFIKGVWLDGRQRSVSNVPTNETSP